jgi:hypothetical protein
VAVSVGKTLRLIGGKVVPATTGLGPAKVQLTVCPLTPQFQFVPVAAIGVSPGGSASVTVTSPLVGPAVGSFVTLSV